MNLSELGALLLFLIVSLIGIAALILLLDVLFPRLVRRARNTAEKMPVRAALVGIVNLIFFTIVSLAALALADQVRSDGAAGLIRLFAALVLLVLNGFLAFGLAAMSRWVGERIIPEASGARQIIAGVAALELAALAPLVGWVLVPLIALVTGYGAVIISLIWRRESTA